MRVPVLSRSGYKGRKIPRVGQEVKAGRLKMMRGGRGWEEKHAKAGAGNARRTTLLVNTGGEGRKKSTVKVPLRVMAQGRRARTWRETGAMHPQRLRGWRMGQGMGEMLGLLKL